MRSIETIHCQRQFYGRDGPGAQPRGTSSVYRASAVSSGKWVVSGSHRRSRHWSSSESITTCEEEKRSVWKDGEDNPPARPVRTLEAGDPFRNKARASEARTMIRSNLESRLRRKPRDADGANGHHLRSYDWVEGGKPPKEEVKVTRVSSDWTRQPGSQWCNEGHGYGVNTYLLGTSIQ